MAVDDLLHAGASILIHVLTHVANRPSLPFHGRRRGRYLLRRAALAAAFNPCAVSRLLSLHHHVGVVLYMAIVLCLEVQLFLHLESSLLVPVELLRYVLHLVGLVGRWLNLLE